MPAVDVYKPPKADDAATPAGDAPAPRFRAIYAAAAIVGLGLLANACWFLWVMWITGWEGLAWVRYSPLAAYPVSILVALSALVPVLRRKRVSPPRVTLFVIFATILGFVSFTIARQWFFDERWFVVVALWEAVAAPVAAVLLTAGGFFALARLLLEKVHPLFIVFTIVATGLANVMAYLTIQIIPAINRDTDYVHAVKMGYPTFWITVLMGISMALALRLTPHPPPPKPPEN